jgi:hypothetical protein
MYILKHVFNNTYMSNTTILIRKQTRDGLRKIGRKSQTYNDLIEELIDHCYSEGDQICFYHT